MTSLDLKKIDSRSAIIFVPGYYGSALDNDDRERVFITAGEALFGDTALSLENETLATPKAPHLIGGGVLRDVPILPFVRIDVYGKFLDRLREIATARNSQLIAFGYDWRQDLTASAAKLDAVIDALHAKGVKRISIVAHSMGCLLTAYELGYGSQKLADAQLDWRGAKKIDDVVFMAGPFEGTFSIFRNMQRGAALAGNLTLLPEDAVASFPASYQLLPFRNAHLVSYQGHEFPFALDDPAYWRKHQLSLLGHLNLSADVRARREVFTEKQVSSAAHFSDLIHFEGSHAPASLRVMNLVGHGHRTVETGFYDEASGEYMFDLDHLSRKHLTQAPLLGEGDGTVLDTAAQLPTPLAEHAKLMGTNIEHAKVFSDERFSQELGTFLR